MVKIQDLITFALLSATMVLIKFGQKVLLHITSVQHKVLPNAHMMATNTYLYANVSLGIHKHTEIEPTFALVTTGR